MHLYDISAKPGRLRDPEFDRPFLPDGLNLFSQVGEPPAQQLCNALCQPSHKGLQILYLPIAAEASQVSKA